MNYKLFFISTLFLLVIVSLISCNDGKTTIIPLAINSSSGNQLVGTKITYSADSVSFKMVYVPGMTFPIEDNDSDEATIDNPFFIGETEVTYELWYTVHAWAIINGYTFQNPGREGHDGTITDPAGEPPTGAMNEPVTYISWRDSIVWCNALTEWYNAENLTTYTCVYTDSGTPIRNSTDGNAAQCDGVTPDPSATGFRLFTSNEWELAARYIDDYNNDGDITDDGEYYPGNHVSGAAADVSNISASGTFAWLNSNALGTTHEVISRMPNALGLYDMSGNVWEWCFDLDGINRVSRGCSWSTYGSLTASDNQVPNDMRISKGLRIGLNASN